MLNVFETGKFDEFVGVMGLRDEDINFAIGILLAINAEAEEVIDGAVKIDTEVGIIFHSSFEFLFYVVTFAEVDDVVDKEA